MTIAVDLAEFFQRPHRSGIQRVGAELCLACESERDIKPVMYSPDGHLVALDPDAFSALAGYFRDVNGASPAAADAIRALGQAALKKGRRLAPAAADVVVAPEVFFDERRIAFYRELLRSSPSRVAFIVFDILPLTHSWAFPSGTSDAFLSYASLVACCRNLAFISEKSAAAFRGRFGGDDPYAVLPLGSDSLSRERVPAKRLPEEPTFIVLGTIEPRKNHVLVLDAFRQLWRRYPSARLVFAGRMGWLDEAGKEKIYDARANCPQFAWHEDVDDRTIARLLTQTTASIFVSAGEGFGLPVVESLWFGTPCIAGPAVPSVQALRDQGVDVLSALSAEALVAALERFLDADYATAKTNEALGARLSTWHEFGQRAKQWLASLPATSSLRAEMLPSLQAPARTPTNDWRRRVKALIPEPMRPVIRSARDRARKLLRMIGP